MAKILKPFKFHQETIDMLDDLVKFENESIQKKGVIGLKYNRTSILESLIRRAYEMSKKGQSFQDVR